MVRQPIARFHDRTEAGKMLAEKLAHYKDRKDALILALPRGGLPVAAEIASALRLPMDMLLVRKLGVPGHEELAMGAIALGNVVVWNNEVLDTIAIPAFQKEEAILREIKELHRRNEAYRQGRPPPEVKDRCVILVDDGLATGATMRAAIEALRTQEPARIVVAVPVAPAFIHDNMLNADETICLLTPSPFFSVGGAYEHFPQLGDEEMRRWL